MASWKPKYCSWSVVFLFINLYPANVENIKKVKRTLVQALRLCTGRTAHRGSRGIALLFHEHGIGRGWRVSVTPRSLFTPGKDPVSILQEAGWAPGPVWTGTENLAPSHPPGSDTRTVQPVASRYTDYATRPTMWRTCWAAPNNASECRWDLTRPLNG